MAEVSTRRDGSKWYIARPLDRHTGKRKTIARFPFDPTKPRSRDNAKLQAQIAERNFRNEQDPTVQVSVGQLRDRYLADHALNWDVVSTTHARGRLAPFCDAHTDMPAGEVNYLLASKWPTSFAQATALSALWSWGVKQSADTEQDDDIRLIRNPWRRIVTAHRKRMNEDAANTKIVRGAGALTAQELESFATYMGQVHGDWLYRLIIFDGYTGLRQGELFAARPSWIMERGQSLHVRDQYRSAVPVEQREKKPKYNGERIIVLQPEAYAVIKNVEGTRLFTNPRDNGTWSKSALYYYWNGPAKAWSKSAEAPEWLRERVRRREQGSGTQKKGALTMHDLRHTYATMLLEWGCSREDVAEQLGDTVEQINNTYGHARAEVANARVRERAAARHDSKVTDITAERRRRARTA